MIWSGRADLNRGPPAPKAGALPGCATPRLYCSTDSKPLPKSRKTLASTKLSILHTRGSRFRDQSILLGGDGGLEPPIMCPPHDRCFQNNATSNRKKSSMFDVAWPATHA